MRQDLVLLPGMMCDERLFAPQVAHFGGRHAVYVPRLVGTDTIEGLARQVLDEIAWERFVVAGLSMGGIVAMEMLAQAPGRIDKAILLDTNHLADAPERRVMRERQIADVQAGRLRQVIVEEMKPHYLAEANRSDAALLDLLVAMALDLGEAAFVDQSRALAARCDYTAVLADWPKPTLLISGAEDALCPPERHQAMAALLPNATLEIVPGAGHITTLEQPDAINRLVDAFLSAT